VVEKYGKEKWRELGDHLIDLLDTPDIEALCASLKGQDADGIIAGVEKVKASAAAAPEAAPAQDANPE
jgi:ribosomal protein L12E/L44/L45/RPP1/RPP2